MAKTNKANAITNNMQPVKGVKKMDPNSAKSKQVLREKPKGTGIGNVNDAAQNRMQPMGGKFTCNPNSTTNHPQPMHGSIGFNPNSCTLNQQPASKFGKFTDPNKTKNNKQPL